METPNVPYGDKYHTVSRFCLVTVGPNSCKLVITREVRFRDKCYWEGRIEKSAIEGSLDWFEELDLVIFEFMDENPVISAMVSDLSAVEDFFGEGSNSYYYLHPDDHPLFADTIDEDNPWYIPTGINIWLLFHVIIMVRIRSITGFWLKLPLHTKISLIVFCLLLASLLYHLHETLTIPPTTSSRERKLRSEQIENLNVQLQTCHEEILKDYFELVHEYHLLEILFDRNHESQCFPLSPFSHLIL